MVLLTSLKTELIRSPIACLPEAATLENDMTAFAAQPIGWFLLNSGVGAQSAGASPWEALGMSALWLAQWTTAAMSAAT